MIKPKEKIGSNIHQNFNTSPEIQAWSKKYNTSISEIERIFKSSGSSISKTLEELRLKLK
jgi:AraC-like DNA-binding protein